jgi:hypothetical protein
LDSLKQALSNFIRSVSVSEQIDIHAFDVWKQYILSTFTKRMEAAHIRQVRDDTVMFCETSQRYLRHLQKDLVIVPVDKAANNISFVCKNLYSKILFTELDSNESQVYEVAEEGDLVVSARHAHTLNSLYKISLNESAQRLAYLYWLPKLHKSPPSQRFIAGASQCTTTQLSKILCDCLTKILDTLREKDESNIVKTSVRRFFVVKGFEEVADFLPRWPGQAKLSESSLHTGDFSTMYTTIPHKDLIEKLQLVLDEVWGFSAGLQNTDSDHVSLRWTKGSLKACEWAISRRRPASFEHSKDVHQFTKLDFHKALSWLIENTYLVNGGKCRRQRIGIPMGTNCAPPTANLYLYAYESIYIDKLVEEALWDQAFSFHMTFRLIDDVLSKDNPFFVIAISKSAEDGGMYPSALTLNITTVSKNVVHFLGMLIKDDKGKVCIDVFDKRKEFPFRVCRYPQQKSLIPEYIAYTVFQGLLHRYYRICTRWDNFCQNAVLLARTLIDQGWSKSKLIFTFRKFLHTRLGMRWKIDLKLLFQRFAKEVSVPGPL